MLLDLNQDTLVVYHGKCPDGFGAALAAWLVFGDKADYLPADYADAAPDVTDKDVYILDFSYNREVMGQMDRSAKSLTLLDHHETALEGLAGFECSCGRIHFDLSKSGARLAWEHFHPDAPVPPLIAFIEDRDLWHFKVPHTREFLAYVDTQPFDFAVWASFLEPEGEAFRGALERGSLLHNQYMRYCRNTGAVAAPLLLDGHSGLMVAGSEDLKNDVGAILSGRSGTFAAIWHLEPRGTIKVSLRSEKGFDVRVIAERFGGGGHATAASFRIPRHRGYELLGGNLPVKRPGLLKRLWRVWSERNA